MAKARPKSPADLTVKERVALFETMMKSAIEQTQIGMSLELEGWPRAITPVLKYVDLIELKAKQDAQKAEAAKK